jgi:hypothetical protein
MLIYQIHIGLTAGVTCQQRMLTPPKHLTPYISIIWGGPCKSGFYSGLFHLPDLDTDLDCGYSVYLSGHTDFDCGLSRFPDLDTPMLTVEFCAINGALGGCDRSTGDAYRTPWHLILPPVSPGVRVCTIFWICISYGIYETDHCSLYYFFILMEKEMTVWCQRRKYT